MHARHFADSLDYLDAIEDDETSVPPGTDFSEDDMSHIASADDMRADGLDDDAREMFDSYEALKAFDEMPDDVA